VIDCIKVRRRVDPWIALGNHQIAQGPEDAQARCAEVNDSQLQIQLTE
jgi:hypothetical protein